MLFIVPLRSPHKSAIHRVNPHFGVEPSIALMSVGTNVRSNSVSAPYSMSPPHPLLKSPASSVRWRYTPASTCYADDTPPPTRQSVPRDSSWGPPQARSRSVPTLQPVRNVAVFKSFSVGVQLGVSIVTTNRRSEVQRPLLDRQHGGRSSPTPDFDYRRLSNIYMTMNQLKTPTNGGRN